MLKRFLLLVFGLLSLENATFAQETLTLTLVKDEFCEYVDLNTENIIQLLSAKNNDFIHFMGKNQFRKSELGKKHEYIAPSTKLNHARLLSKDGESIHFTFSPIQADQITHFISDLQQHSKILKTIQKANKKTFIVQFPQFSINKNYQLEITEKIDSEEYVGRTIEVKTLEVNVELRM